jgi:cytochrome b
MERVKEIKMTEQNFTWDLIVRITHWTVALLFVLNFFIVEEGSELHEWIGYGVIGTICIRLLWGLIAPSPAKLTAFKPSINQALIHLKEVAATKKDYHIGHNPAGAIMIWLMWFLLLSTGLTGWSMALHLYDREVLEEVHEFFANTTMIAVTIHVCAVILMSKITQKQYIKSMLWRGGKSKE